MKNKIITCCLKICFFSIILFTVGCVTKPVPIPGESAVIIENLYVEYSNIADTYFKLEDYKNAIKYYTLSMENKNLYWQSYYKMAKCYALLSDWNNALTMYEKLLERDKDNNTLKASLAYIYSMQGDVKKALALYDELLALESENEKYLENTLAILLSSKETYNENVDRVNELYTKIEKNFENNKNLKTFETTINSYKENDKSEDKTDGEPEQEQNSEEKTEKEIQQEQNSEVEDSTN